METGVVFCFGVPALGDVDFAVRGPFEGVGGEHPVGGPDAGGGGGKTGCGEVAARSGEGLVRG